MSSAGAPRDLFEEAARLLATTSVEEKIQGAQRLFAQWQEGLCSIEGPLSAVLIDVPGRPPEPVLVHPRELPRRRLGSEAGRVALLHALAHIEFNAVHLALDACYRFRHMPLGYYADWLGVAADEAVHFGLLEAALQTRGFRYGSFPAHDGLWEMAMKTRHDVLARMALVPRTLEARGLDVTPELCVRFAEAGDSAAAQILNRILADEVGHVAVGNRWFDWLCRKRRLDREATFAALSAAHHAPRPHLPLNRAARLQAGFTERELDLLEAAAERPAPDRRAKVR